MKSNLLKGIILIGVVALSSCATLSKVSHEKTFGDDVYYTKAKASESNYYVPQYIEQPQPQIARNDDYYYYGDYESRIRRFGYASPFDYNDDYYESYQPYTPYSYQDTVGQNYYADNDYTYDPYYDELGTYSAYDFGYGDYYGYDDFGYGIAFSTYSYGGGSRASHRKDYSYSNNNSGPVFVGAGGRNNRYGNNPFGVNAGKNPGTGSIANNGSGPVFSGGGAPTASTPVFRGARPGGSNAVYPGRPGTNANGGQTDNNIAGTNRPIRPANQAPRNIPVNQPQPQQPTIERSSPPPSSSSSSGSSGGGGGGSSSGGGGRPVRP